MTSLLLVEFDWNTALIRFSVNTFFIASMILIISKQMVLRRFSFSFLMISLIVFFLCFTLKNFDLNLGMALGLFAIFGILRYRTTPLEVKDMTYLFIVIGISLINALSNKKMSFSELIAANFIILLATFLLERYWSRNSILTKVINYENIDNIHPKNHQKLKEDLESRLGIEIIEFEIGDVNFLRDTANIKIKFKK